MPTIRRTWAAAAALGLLGPIALSGQALAAQKVTAIDPSLTQVNLLNINDFHGRLDGGSLDGVLGKQVACTIETAKKNLGDDKTIFLSAGDSVGASTFASSIAQDEPTIAYLNALQLKASAVGNHEFDQGFGDLTSRVIPHATWTYLGANVYQRGTTTPALPEFKVVTVNGVKVGVIGAVTQQAPHMVSPTGVSGLDFGDPVAAVNRVADQLTDGNEANGEADILVAEYHEGAASSSGLSSEMAANPVFARIVTDTSAKVSVIFNGHTHALYAWDGATASGTRSVSESASYGAYVGQIQLGYDPATKTVKQYVAANVATKTANLAACVGDPQYDAAAKIVTDAVATAKALGSRVIGHVSADITRAYSGGSWVNGRYTATVPDDRGRESTLSNLEAQVWLEAMNVPGRPGADLGVQNPGGVRADLKYAQSGTEGDGNVTYAEAAAINPFANTLMTTTITGAQVKTLLEQQWQPAGSSRPFLQLGLSKNVRWTFDESKPAGSKVTGVFVNDKPLDSTATYRVATNSYLASGGDNFGALAGGTNTTDSGLVDMDAFVTWLIQNTSASKPLAPDFRKRGVQVTNAPTVINYGKTTTFTITGWDMTSLGSPANTSAKLSITPGGRGFYPVGISSVHVDGLPSLDGVAQVSFKLIGKYLPDDRPRTVYLQVVSDQTGTTVTVPVRLKG